MGKHIMISLDDERTSYLADAISNKTSKKILKYLIDNEACETEIARDLKLPANTVNYNVDKLLKARLIEKSRNYLWSKKGKKIVKYKVASKNIVISPKSSLSKGVLTSFLITIFGAVVVKFLVGSQKVFEKTNDVVGGGDYSMEVARDFAIQNSSFVGSIIQSNLWVWFLFGGIFALVIFMILNWRKL